MDDEYFKNKEAQDVPEEATPQEKPFEERLEDLEDKMIEDFRIDLLRQAEETILRQNEQISELQENTVSLRDEVALQCYVPLLNEVSDYEKAAVDAYRAADVFLRAREKGDINE